MKNKEKERVHGIPQEGLKAIACITMLADHIGAIFFPEFVWLRIAGRISFPLFCFLLSEGAARTRNPKNYALRLSAGALISEVPYDLAFFGRLTWGKQSVMVTLLIGYLAIWAMQHCKYRVERFCICIVAGVLALISKCSYGTPGVAMMLMFYLTRGHRKRYLEQVLLVAGLCLLIPSQTVLVAGWQLPIQLLGVAAMLFVCQYNGQKLSRSTLLQSGFYLFYPAHLVFLLMLT